MRARKTACHNRNASRGDANTIGFRRQIGGDLWAHLEPLSGGKGRKPCPLRKGWNPCKGRIRPQRGKGQVPTRRLPALRRRQQRQDIGRQGFGGWRAVLRRQAQPHPQRKTLWQGMNDFAHPKIGPQRQPSAVLWAIVGRLIGQHKPMALPRSDIGQNHLAIARKPALHHPTRDDARCGHQRKAKHRRSQRGITANFANNLCALDPGGKSKHHPASKRNSAMKS